MIYAADSAILIAAVEKRRAPVGTEGIDQPNAAVRVPKGNQILAQQPDAQWRAIVLIELRRQ
jgi:hypothetical protein